MQLYKIRDFGALISDTFTFFKENGKNYFKNYILLNGTLLILLVVLYIVGYKSIFAQAFSSNLNGNSFYYEQYFQENPVVFVILGIAFLFLCVASMILVYSYPVFYLKRYAETGDRKISMNDIMDDLKKSIGKILIFIFGLMFILMPIITSIMLLSVLLMFIIIGFVLIFIIGPAIVNLINFTLFDYYNTDKGFFSSLSYAMRAQFSYPNGNMKSPFWKYWGSSAVIMLIIQIVGGIFSFVPAMMMMGSILTVPDADKSDTMGAFFQGTMGTTYFIFNGIAMLVGFLLYNVIYINAGLMYYDSRIDLHRNEDFNEIESIGTSEF